SYFNYLLSNIDTSSVGIYYGIKYKDNNIFIDYGIINDSTLNTAGLFKINRSVINSLISINNKYIKNFSDILSKLDISNLKLLMKMKKDLESFIPGYFTKKSKIKIENDVISIGYFGIG